MTSVKICFEDEVRRVLLREEDGTTLTFNKLINTLYKLFPALAGKVFALTWLDDEGDVVTCSSDAELDDAIMVMQSKGTLLRFTVQLKGTDSAPVKPKLVHANITCDECGVKPIVGIRYKCAIRHDFDLCEACEAKRIQPYPMIKIVEPAQAPQVLIYGLPDGTRNDEGSPWQRGFGRHGFGHGHGHGHHHGHRFQGPPNGPFAANGNHSSGPDPFNAFKRRGCGWGRRWYPADCVPDTKPETASAPVPESQPEHSQLEEDLIEKAILESLEINEPKSDSASAPKPEAKPPVAEGTATASVFEQLVKPLVEQIVKPLVMQPIPAPPTPFVKPSMKGVKDVTFPDGTIVQPGTSFRKVWRVRNDGAHAWPEGVVLVSAGGDVMGDVSARQNLPTIGPGEEIEVGVSLTAPASPGMYTAYYRLQCRDQFFGNRLWATIVVTDQDPDWHVVAQKPESPVSVQPAVTPAPVASVTVESGTKSEEGTVIQETTLAESLRLDNSRKVPAANPVPVPAPVPAVAPVAPAVAPTRAAALLWRRELEILQEMGLADAELAIPLLQTHLGSPLSLSGDKNARPNPEGMQNVILGLLSLQNA